ncbi:GspH/FimT family pseudopilin [Litorilituus lipolyticus]|uniref:Type II secretion system protein H n=1 Tax=Litorilituus lipolyticus TaxID=2491017 RepID=A0A502L6R9_9GAMM|nr:GspH/FimT family pseudopilin [Litorilituus lipolyticus]TPH18165.1 prepilin-type N-terminal cleavage/methylation domain-containing protein [Litorilituus lipolyticus]
MQADKLKNLTTVTPSLSRAAKKKTVGFTLIEFMVTLVIAGIITTIALPNLGEFIVKMRVGNEVSEMQRLLMTARNMAINTEQNVTVCPMNANACTGANNWLGNIGVIAADGTVIKQKEAISSGDNLVFADNNITYSATGLSNNNNIATFSYCPKGKVKLSRGVTITISGRSYLSEDINGDGRHQDRTGANIDCS